VDKIKAVKLIYEQVTIRKQSMVTLADRSNAVIVLFVAIEGKRSNWDCCWNW